MATYKVIQDIEADDKLVGPLSLRQFIYAAISAVCFYVCYFFISHNLLYFLVIFLPIALLSGFFAFPWKHDQPTEVWALARLRFSIKPHKRIWDQSGQKELVTITAPKKVDINYTNGLSPTEVQSRLKALAETIDTRGWVTKNVNVNLNEPTIQSPVITPSDRLVDVESLPQDVPEVDVRADDDILDETSNTTAAHFKEMIDAREQAYHQQLVQKAQSGVTGEQPTPTPDYWFLNQTSKPDKSADGYTTFGSRVVVPGETTPGVAGSTPYETPEEKEFIDKINSTPRYPEVAYSRMKIIQPPSDFVNYGQSNTPIQAQPTPPIEPPRSPSTTNMTQSVDPAILNLASDNNLNVTSIAHEINETRKAEQARNEVIIPLH